MGKKKLQENKVEDLADAITKVCLGVSDIRSEICIFRTWELKLPAPRTEEDQKKLDVYYDRRYTARDKVYEAIDRALSLIPVLAPYIQYMPDVDKDEYLALLRKKLKKLKTDFMCDGPEHCEAISQNSPIVSQMAWLAKQVENIDAIDSAVYDIANTGTGAAPDENGFMNLEDIDVGAFVRKVDIINNNIISGTTLDRILAEYPAIRKCRAVRLKNGEYKTHQRRLLIHRLDIERHLD